MTKLWVMSDIHDDTNRYATPRPYSLPHGVDADVCIIAGDICGRLAKMGRGWLEHQFREMPIVIVPGNHCFYKASLDREVDRFRELLQVDWIHILDGDSIEIAGTRFVGGALWTDYQLNGDTAAAKEAHILGMIDLDQIRVGGDGSRKKARPNDLEREHIRIRRAIDEVLSIPFAGPSVVVTHHAPHPKSLRDGFEREVLDAAYASDLTDLIMRRQPEVWIHGHVHQPKDYRVGETRIVCNPRGYIRAIDGVKRDFIGIEVTTFDPRLVIDVHRRPRIDPWGYPMPYHDEVALWRQNEELAAMSQDELLATVDEAILQSKGKP